MVGSQNQFSFTVGLLILGLLTQGCPEITKIRGVTKADQQAVTSIVGLFESEECIHVSAQDSYNRASAMDAKASTTTSYRIALYVDSKSNVYYGNLLYSDTQCGQLILATESTKGSTLRYVGGLSSLSISGMEGIQTHVLSGTMDQQTLIQFHLDGKGYFIAYTNYDPNLPISTREDVLSSYPLLEPFVKNPEYKCIFDDGVNKITNPEYCQGLPNYMKPSKVAEKDLLFMVELANAVYTKSSPESANSLATPKQQDYNPATRR